MKQYGLLTCHAAFAVLLKLLWISKDSYLRNSCKAELGLSAAHTEETVRKHPEMSPMSLWIDRFAHLYIYVAPSPLFALHVWQAAVGRSLNLAALGRTGRIKSSFVAEQQVLRGRKCQFCLLALKPPPVMLCFIFSVLLELQSIKSN